jgi:UPF0271 protein
MIKTIDLNCDLGEGMGNDSKIMPLITSCSIACGGHYGTKESIHTAIKLAKAHGVKIGAHPSYTDKENFGRKSLQLSRIVLQEMLRKQLDLFWSVSKVAHHIKPHGALYNDTYFSSELASTVLEVFSEYATDIGIYCAPGSQLEQLTPDYGFYPIREGFGDRLYNDDGSLLNRSIEGAVIEDKNLITAQVITMIEKKAVKSFQGTEIPLEVKTICFHGDGNGIVENLTFLRKVCTQKNIPLAY